MQFTKMQGIGNDYIYVNLFMEHVAHPSDLSRHISDRHFGIGSDGLILIDSKGTVQYINPSAYRLLGNDALKEGITLNSLI